MASAWVWAKTLVQAPPDCGACRQIFVDAHLGRLDLLELSIAPYRLRSVGLRVPGARVNPQPDPYLIQKST